MSSPLGDLQQELIKNHEQVKQAFQRNPEDTQLRQVLMEDNQQFFQYSLEAFLESNKDRILQRDPLLFKDLQETMINTEPKLFDILNYDKFQGSLDLLIKTYAEKLSQKTTRELFFLYTENTYQISEVSGGRGPIYNFLAPQEYLQDKTWKNDQEKLDQLVFYFHGLYPLSNPSKWRAMGVSGLLDYYRNLDFWYTFNTYWGVSPKPVVFDDLVLKKWEKNTFFQAGTIVQSSITSLSWDYLTLPDGSKEKFYFAGRLNNASQIDPVLTYTGQDGKPVTLRSVVTDPNYWPTILGKKIEITSWGWNPYPFGFFSQGPFRGSGIFLDIPKTTIIGTCHWDIIYKCRASNISEERIWTEIMNHELTRIQTGSFSLRNAPLAPYVLLSDGATVQFSNIYTGIGGWTPFLLAYFLFIVGGFGGIGNPWQDGYFTYYSWDPNKWKQNNKSFPSNLLPPLDPEFVHPTYGTSYYTPVIQRTQDEAGKWVYTMPEDQSVKGFTFWDGQKFVTDLQFQRSSQEFWNVFSRFFKRLQTWDTNWAEQMWKHPFFPDSATKLPAVANTSDDLMMFMATGNADILRFSPWGGRLNIQASLSKFSKDPMEWSHVEDHNGQIFSKGKVRGFPVGQMVHQGSGYSFAVRAQMPNVNGDICSEFADFRVTTPGQLATGSGDQQYWAKFIKNYAKTCAFTVDPMDASRSQPFEGDFAPWLPEVKPQKPNDNENKWNPQDNPILGKTFYDFDIYSGKWRGDLAYTGITEGQQTPLPTFLGNLSNGSISTFNPVTNKYVPTLGPVFDIYSSDNCPNAFDQVQNLVPQPDPTSQSFNSTGGNPSCQNKEWVLQNCPTAGPPPCATLVNAPVGTSYYPFPTDNFATGVVGYQGDNVRASIGSSQTRWWLCSKGICWNYAFPFVNRTLLVNDPQIQKREPFSNRDLIMKWSFFGVLILLSFLLAFFKPLYPWNWAVVCILILIAIIIVIVPLFDRQEKMKLELYMSLMYPAVPSSRWKRMDPSNLRQFYLTLHVWAKNIGLSPTDYVGTQLWKKLPPMGRGSRWTSFTTRKQCVLGTPQAYNPFDNKMCIGNDNHTENDTPSGILYRGRQLLCLESGAQQTSFFQPSSNCWIDSFNAFPTVNDTELDAWEKTQFVEILTTWCPFPDGAYLDWSPGSGIFVDLGKHLVGYTGLDVIRRIGDVLVKNKGNLRGGLKNVYLQEWSRTGLDNMFIQKDEKLVVSPDLPPCNVCGLYGSEILTTAQFQEIQNLADSTQGQEFWATGSVVYPADGPLFKLLASYIDFQYFNVSTMKWQKQMPAGKGYVENYPFPLIFHQDEKGTFLDDGNGKPQLNEAAFDLPWKYQMFNMTFMMRRYCIDLLFLNEWAIPETQVKKSRGAIEYVDWLKAQVKTPLRSPRTWEKAIDIVMDLLSRPLAHPVFSVYNRCLNQGFDGPLMILTNSGEFKNGKPSVQRIQTGALDKTVYIQDMKSNKGTAFRKTADLPQFLGANLEIDHWMSELCKLGGYDSCCRIQHWCGNKGLTYDMEIAHFRMEVPGNLISGTLQTNIYEVWKLNYEKWLYLRDPFEPRSNIYNENYSDIYKGNTINQSISPDWTRPPWVGYNPQQSLYGWETEKINNWQLTNRLSYSIISCNDIALSISFPEGNKYIWNYFWRKYKGSLLHS